MGMDNIDEPSIRRGSFLRHGLEFPEIDARPESLEDRLERRRESWKQAFALGFIGGAWATLAIWLIVQAVAR